MSEFWKITEIRFSVKFSITVLNKKVKAIYNGQMVHIDYSPFWDETLRQVENDFIENGKESEFRIWFNILYVDSKDNKITASVPSQYIHDQMFRRGYIDIIQNKLVEISGQDLEVELIVVPKKNIQQPKTSTVSSTPVTNTAPAANVYSTPNPVTPSFIEKHVPVYSQPVEISQPKITPVAKTHPNLNSSYTFENFVSGDENEYVYNAALSIAKNPGKGPNPLLIYGGVGLGKTHLMQAIGNEIYKNFGLNIIYISAENFTNEFIASLQQRTQPQFKNKYRKTDVLLIDDIHFFQDKEGTQEELFHTFNALYENQKQLVFTCDRPVSELKNMTERLKSRFQRGLNADIHMPKYEIRRAIIDHKLKTINKTLSPEIIDLIAHNIQTNVRDLEACLTTVIGWEELSNKPLTIERVKKILSDTFAQDSSPIKVETIQKVVAEYFSISFNDIKGKKQSKNIVFPRQIAQYLSRELTEYSTTEIGKEFNKDHTTVMHAYEKIENTLHMDASLEETLRILKKKIKEYKSEWQLVENMVKLCVRF